MNNTKKYKYTVKVYLRFIYFVEIENFLLRVR